MTSPCTRGDGAGAAEDQPFEAVVRVMQQAIEERRAILRTAVKWGNLPENPARNVDLPALVNVRPKWALTVAQATALLAELPPLARTMVGLALMSGLRRGELFALRWRDFDERGQCLTVREAVYEGAFSTPKTAAGVRQIPLSEATVKLTVDWRAA